MTRTSEITRQENTVNTRQAFEDLLYRYETAYLTDPNGQDFANVLQELGTIIAYSVLKKCIQTSHNESLLDVRKDMNTARHSLDIIKRANNELYTFSYNQDGDLISIPQREEYTTVKTRDGKEKRVKKENALETAYNKLIREHLGDGLDLVNTAIATLLDETQRHGANLERTYFVKRLKRKVYIKLEDSVNGWEEVETSPIKETYKAVRREIENSRAIATDPRNGYSYLEDVARDSETGEETAVYRRLDKYADLGGYAVDSSGKQTLYSASESTVQSMDELVSSLNLSDRQATVLKLRLRGYGYKAIGTYLGIDSKNVSRTCKQIQAKVLTVASESSELFHMEKIERYTRK